MLENGLSETCKENIVYKGLFVSYWQIYVQQLTAKRFKIYFQSHYVQSKANFLRMPFSLSHS